ncbi:MAG: hypothetical protein Q8O67_06680 [Deltaproteobacteria bacterium]|nr:hypothetical protein [Deltaproteobacteria bacterium]
MPTADASPADGGDYYTQLRALTNGAHELSAATRKAITEAKVRPLHEGAVGVVFGSRMQDVINVWGRPESIWMMNKDKTQLKMGGSSFTFINDSLIGISVHRVDLPLFTVGDGQVKMGEKAPDLVKVFPGAIAGADADEVELPNGLTVSVNQYEGKVIAIRLQKKP